MPVFSENMYFSICKKNNTQGGDKHCEAMRFK